MSETRTLLLVCPNGHKRELPHASERETSLIKECVERRISKCDRCRRDIVRVEEEKPS